MTALKAIYQKLCFWKRRYDFAIIDGWFPNKGCFGFRHYEITGLLERMPGAHALAMDIAEPGPLFPFPWARYGMKKKRFKKNLSAYLKIHPENRGRIVHISTQKDYKIRLAMSYFVAETYTLLPFYNRNRIPFVFVLYPGGGFGLEHDGSDAMLREIFSSPYFRAVIVTQDVTRKYILKKNMCPENKIHFLFGGYTQWNKNESLPKKFFPTDKNTIDICFVAAKYTPKGYDKGFDIFIEAAHKLAEKHENVRFHVVGGFDENEIDVSEIKNRITFYGYRKPDFLKSFYSGMDICVSPSRFEGIYKGNFDGFPLGLDAMVLGCALFTTDPLQLNAGRFDGDELVIVNPDSDDVYEKIDSFLENNDLSRLYDLSLRGQIKIDFLDTNPIVRLDKVFKILESLK